MAEPCVPFSLLGWITDHLDDFEPPVSNKLVWDDGDHMFMIVRGPNARNDFHVDPGDEIFHQLRGDIRVDLVVDGEVVTRIVREGDVMLVPGGVPHAPMRPADSWGLVVERRRRPGEVDCLQWRCPGCGDVLHEQCFELADIETELGAAIARVNADEALRTCGRCGTVLAVPGPFAFDEDPA